MPHQTAPEDDDPVIASYPVYLTSPHYASPPNASAEILPDTAQKLVLLQYPAYRPSDTPYNARNLQKPTSLRIKPNTGLLELDIPIDTKLNYNPDKGSKYATSLKRSRIIQEGGTHGLSGGFNTGPAGRNIREEEDIDMKTIPAHSGLSDDPTLNVQTLGGKIVKPSTGDPIYLLGSFKGNSMHLPRLDALVQVRPQLPHLDALDELERNRGLTALARAKGKDGAAIINGDVSAALPPPTGPSTRPESKAIDIKLKPSGPASQSNDLTTNTNAKLLRAIQQESWQIYDWIDEDETESHDHAEKALHLSMPPGDDLTPEPPNLESAINNSEWLDLMSAPRIEHGKKAGDKGLMGKVRGRERERQRRKRNEAARREKATTTTSVHNQASAEANSAPGPSGQEREDVREDGDATAGEDTADDAQIGPSDEESSEDEQGDRQAGDRDGGVGDDEGEGEGEGDIEMLDPPNLPTASQVDGADTADDDAQEVQPPTTAADQPTPTPRRRGRPRKSQVVQDPIVVDD
ncbi:hypothetical protein EPUS_02569 [Endocarpon pusillum Z07020]|uniref:Uncharacterized protein n=1 Tax=Endocarpon pusillum (strain Z07020 / HMAS-L-300199) TaxID=1263415 RepID=U1GF41_ENDPU|nr:uncharacterized protein EPUS_02569 [Endocarpon pusillum Z07020]ERF70703.1 hypothetical protein EPUS_02569 [Endocarpon pusillum Z07020]